MVTRETVLAAARAAAVVGFADTCTITHLTAESTDILTGTVTQQRVTVYSGMCRVQQAAAPWAGPADVGQAAIRISALELQLPVVGSEDIRIDDEVTITACVNDTELVGRRFSVVGQHHATHKTTRRIPIQEILS